MSSIAALIEKKDISFFFFLNRKLNCPALDIFMKCLTLLGSTTFAILITGALMLNNLTAGVSMFVNLAASQAAIQLLKRLVNRPRPYCTHKWILSLKPPKCRYSFPSGHSGTALAIALTISHFIPGLSIIIFPLAIGVGLSRIYLGCHYPTDVSAGFFISIAVFLLAQ